MEKLFGAVETVNQDSWLVNQLFHIEEPGPASALTPGTVVNKACPNHLTGDFRGSFTAIYCGFGHGTHKILNSNFTHRKQSSAFVNHCVPK